MTDTQAIINRLKEGQVWDFPGGVHPAQNKAISLGDKIQSLPLPKRLYIPVKQHIGTDGHLLVEPGQQVKKGQAISASMHPFSVPVHASTSGTVISIQPYHASHPSGIPQLTVELEPDGKDEWISLEPIIDFKAESKLKILEKICQSGVAGLGGAGFPTHIKLASERKVEFLIINGVECEPYITSDDMLMRHEAQSIIDGIEILEHILSPKQVVIAIEDNKPHAISVFKALCPAHMLVVAIPTKYPAGGEKQLIQVLTHREVPENGLPIDVGVIMQNVGTCYAIAQAINTGKPLVERVVTITGGAVSAPANYWCLMGTPVKHLADHAGYNRKDQHEPNIVVGGPMMGFNLHTFDAPIVKTTNCILLLSDKEYGAKKQEMACIRCGACTQVCPANLLPQQLYWYSKSQDYDKAQAHDLQACIECGSCAYVCPSQIPLVQYYRQAKSDIKVQIQEKAKSEKAKQRFEARKTRLEEEKKAREEKHKKAAEARLARANNSKEQTDTAATNKSAAVAAAIERAKARKAQQNATDSGSPETSESDEAVTSVPAEDKKAKVAAAIARAKAKKAQRASSAPQDEHQAAITNANHGKGDENTATKISDDDKKAKIAAAIARAKAKKAQQADASGEQHGTAPSLQSLESNSVSQVQSESVTEAQQQQDKKAKIAAAIARAKAKKLEREKLNAASLPNEKSQGESD